jgi:hypothetical protein
VDNIGYMSFITGQKIPGNYLKGGKEGGFGNLLPISKSLLKEINGTSIQKMLNHQSDDSLTTLFGKDSSIDNGLMLRLDSYFCGGTLNIGDT